MYTYVPKLTNLHAESRVHRYTPPSKHMHTQKLTCTCVPVCVCMFTHMHTHRVTWACAYACVCVTGMCICAACMYMCVHSDTQRCAFVCTHMQRCLYAYMCVHPVLCACMHTGMCIYVHRGDVCAQWAACALGEVCAPWVCHMLHPRCRTHATCSRTGPLSISTFTSCTPPSGHPLSFPGG